MALLQVHVQRRGCHVRGIAQAGRTWLATSEDARHGGNVRRCNYDKEPLTTVLHRSGAHVCARHPHGTHVRRTLTPSHVVIGTSGRTDIRQHVWNEDNFSRRPDAMLGSYWPASCHTGDFLT